MLVILISSVERACCILWTLHALCVVGYALTLYVVTLLTRTRSPLPSDKTCHQRWRWQKQTLCHRTTTPYKSEASECHHTTSAVADAAATAMPHNKQHSRGTCRPWKPRLSQLPSTDPQPAVSTDDQTSPQPTTTQAQATTPLYTEHPAQLSNSKTCQHAARDCPRPVRACAP